MNILNLFKKKPKFFPIGDNRLTITQQSSVMPQLSNSSASRFSDESQIVIHFHDGNVNWHGTGEELRQILRDEENNKFPMHNVMK